MNYKKLLLNLLAATVLFVGNSNFAFAEEHCLTILHTNDVHGRLKPIDYNGKKDVGGFAARAKLIKEIKSQNKNILVLDAGDIAQGTLFFKFFNGVPDVKFMSEAGYDAAELGNHEFDKGTSVVKKMVGSVNFPFLCANIRFLDNPELQKKVKPYTIKNYNGFKVGVIGLIAPDLKTLVNNSQCLDVLNPAETSRNIIKEIDSKVDLIVVLSHMGIDEDIKLANEVPQVDIIVGGHSHTFLRHPKRILHGDTSTLIVQDGEFGVNLGELDVKIKDKNVESYAYKQIPVDGKNQDKIFAEKITKLSKKVDLLANQKIGQFKLPMEINSVKMKSGLTSAGTLVAQAIKAKTPDVDVVLQNAGGIRGNKILPSGFITKADVFELYPFENTIVTAEIKGSELKSVLETSSRFLPDSSSGFLQSFGVEYSVNTLQSRQILSDDGLCILKEGNRVFDIKINGTPVEMDKYYKVAMNDFIFNGGNGYSQFNNAKNVQKTDMSIQDAIIEYIKKNSPVSIEVKDRINLY